MEPALKNPDIYLCSLLGYFTGVCFYSLSRIAVEKWCTLEHMKVMEISESRYHDSRLYCLFQMTSHLGDSLSVIKMSYTGVILTEQVVAWSGTSSNRVTWIHLQDFFISWLSSRVQSWLLRDGLERSLQKDQY